MNKSTPTICDKCSQLKDYQEKNGQWRCKPCRAAWRKNRYDADPEKYLAKHRNGKPLGRPKTQTLICIKHNIEKTKLNSAGYRYCEQCSKKANQKSYFKNHDRNLILSKTKNERLKEYKKQWQEDNKEKRSEQSRIRYLKIREQHREYMKNWTKSNPERTKEYNNRRRVRLANAEGQHSIVEWLTLCKAQNNACNHCHKVTKLTRDHIIPLSKGGSDYIANIQGLCKSCNCKKHAKIGVT